MKYLLPILLLSACIQLHAQKKNNRETQRQIAPESMVTHHNTYGFISGIRLDSLDAAYAQFDLRIDGAVTFDYGQRRTTHGEMLLQNADGGALIFHRFSVPLLLNFFNYNGWDFDQTYNPSPDRVIYLLKKRKPGT